MLTIHVQALLDQVIAAQMPDAVGQLVQLPVQSFLVQSWALGVPEVCAEHVHTCGRPILLWPGEIEWRGEGTEGGEQRSGKGRVPIQALLTGEFRDLVLRPPMQPSGK